MIGKVRNERGNIFQYMIAVIAACLVFAIMQGIHDNYGIMLNGIIDHTGISYASVSLVVAVGQIMYGVTQPLFGMLALRKSNAFVMLCGCILMAVGLIVTPFCHMLWSLLLFFGIILPSGTGALCFGIVMGSITPIIGEKKAAFTSGIVQASAGVGDALMSPGLQLLIGWRGILTAMTAFSVPILLMLPAIIWIGRKNCSKMTPNSRTEVEKKASGHGRAEGTDGAAKEEGIADEENLTVILRTALRTPAYWCLLIGFSTCGFHMAIIETHLFSQYVSSGIPESIASLTLTVYGVMTMIGAMVIGFLGIKFKMRKLLGMVYGCRVLIAAAFLIFPKTIPFAFIATGLLGLTGDSTVPPTTGIISSKLGAARMAIVYGAIFIGHQIGAFVSAWLGGVLVDTPLGYSALWMVDLCLAAAAAVASFRIRD